MRFLSIRIEHQGLARPRPARGPAAARRPGPGHDPVRARLPRHRHPRQPARLPGPPRRHRRRPRRPGRRTPGRAHPPDRSPSTGGRDARGNGTGSRSRTRRRARRSRPSPSSARDEVRAMVAAARAAQPGWEALGFEGRAEVLLTARRWMVANAERVIGDDRRRDRPARRRDPVRRALLRPRGARVLGQEGARVPRRRGHRVGVAVRARPADGRPLRAARRGRRDRALELPAQQLLRRLHPGAGRRQLGGHEAVGDHPADLAADGRDAGRVRDPRERLPGRHRPRRDRRGADRRGRLRDVHRLGRGPARR